MAGCTVTKNKGSKGVANSYATISCGQQTGDLTWIYGRDERHHCLYSSTILSQRGDEFISAVCSYLSFLNC